MDLAQHIMQVTGAADAVEQETLQSLWSGYGAIVRYALTGARHPSIVVKHVCPPSHTAHPRGWNSDLSHQRKVRSYEVEATWYQRFSSRCNPACKVPECLGVAEANGEQFILLEDLDASGFGGRRRTVTPEELEHCLRWLASFHATFLGEAPDGLWPVGTYWHLATRPQELEALDDPALKRAASEIDRRLTAARYQTFVHGDAKLANFCFDDDQRGVAAVDFQYVGGGCGMKDVAYFLGSCLSETDCERLEELLLDRYFKFLNVAVEARHPTVDVAALEDEWRGLFAVAWTDFHRFIKGWSPGHWKITGYSERLSEQVLSSLAQASDTDMP